MLAAAVGRQSINLVNSLRVAESRGIEVEQVRASPHGDYAEYIEVRVRGGTNDICVAGALLAAAHPRVVRIGDYHVDIVPRGTVVVIRNRDVPGVIGRVGTLLGDAGVNIGEYHQARLSAGGDALAAVSVDGRLEQVTVEKLRAVPEIIEVRQAQLD